MMSGSNLKPVAVEMSPTVDPAQLTNTNLKWKVKRQKYVIVAAVILGLAFIVGAVMMAYLVISQNQTVPQIQVFQLVLREPSSDKAIPVDVKVDKNQSVEYMTSPEVDQDGNNVGEVQGIRDNKNGFEAYVYNNGTKCLIGRIQPNDNTENYVNGSIYERMVEVNMTFGILNQTIHPYVLSSLVGNKVMEFCAGRDGVWMIPVQVEDNHTRKKRWGCWSCGGGGYAYRCWWGCYGWGWYRSCYRRCGFYY